MKTLFIFILAASLGSVFMQDQEPENLFLQEITDVDELDFFGSVIDANVTQINLLQQGSNYVLELKTANGLEMLPISGEMLNAEQKLRPCGCRWGRKRTSSWPHPCTVVCLPD